MTDTIQVKSQDGLFDNFTVVQNTFIEAGFDPTEIAVYLVLCYYANPKQGNTCYPSYDTIAQKVNRSRRRVIDSIEVLEKSGVIERETRPQGNGKHHLSNVYTILPIAGKVITVWVKGSKKNDTESIPDANDVENFTTPSEKNDKKVCQKFHPNNNYLEQELLEQSEDLIPETDEEQKPDKLAMIHRAYYSAFALSLTPKQESMLEDYELEDVINAIDATRLNHPRNPFAYMQKILANIVRIPDDLSPYYKMWRATAFTLKPTKTPPDYEAKWDDVTQLRAIQKVASFEDVFQFCIARKLDQYWHDKVISLRHISENIATWKEGQQ